VVKSRTEAALIARIVRALAERSKPPGLTIGPGDDAAVLSPRPGSRLVVTCDSFFEETHFYRNLHPPDVVGFKALSRAASDLAAMGATPRFYFLALAMPASLAGIWLDKMLAGMARAARRLGLSLAGGDTSAQPTVSLILTVVGEIPQGLAVTRGGALAGDRLFVSGRLGEARLGLELLRRGKQRRSWATRFLRRHFYPQPRIALGRWLAQNKLASSMIDLSDGLSTDLHNLCRASEAGARIYTGQIPSVAIPRMAGLRANALQFALHGGDDYELLFAVPSRLAHRIPASFRGLRLSCIGEITGGPAILLQDANRKSKPLGAEGWDPFRAR
jgi:thiamine-monophosphate kinase